MNSSAATSSVQCEARIFVSNTTEARAVTVFLIIMNIITAPVTSLLNGLVIIAVKRKLRLKTKSSIALACLATTDCFMGVIGQPMFIALNIVVLQDESSYTYCLIKQLSIAVLTVLGRATNLHLALMYLVLSRSITFVICINDFAAKDAQERQKNKQQNKRQAKPSPVFH